MPMGHESEENTPASLVCHFVSFSVETEDWLKFPRQNNF